MSITKYLNIPTSEHQVKTNFMAWLTDWLNIINDNIANTSTMPSAFDIDRAVGVQLDTIGAYVGRTRTLNYNPASGASPVLDDTHYVTALKAKIAQNSWDGTVQQMYSIWNALFPNNALSIVDNQNMTMSAIISGQLDALTTEMIANKLIIPKPSGVGLTLITSTSITDNVSVGMAMSVLDVVSATIKTKSWSSLSGTWSNIPDGTTWKSL